MGNLLKNMSVKEILKSLTVTISAWNVSHSYGCSDREDAEYSKQTEVSFSVPEIGGYMTTNMTADEMEELADYKIAEDTVKVPGEIIEKDGHAQYLVDNKELKK